MQNFKIVKNDFSFKATTHNFKLIFYGATSTNAANLFDIPLNHFKFTSLVDMLAEKFQFEFLVGHLRVSICCFVYVIISFGFISLMIWFIFRLYWRSSWNYSDSIEWYK